MLKSTKIVATISDYHCEPEFIAALFREGMNVVRLNTAHTTAEGMERVVRNVRSVSDSIAIMIDTKGPEIRTTPNAEPGDISFRAGQNVLFTTDGNVPTTAEVIGVNYPHLADEVHPGDELLIDDGALAFRIESVDPAAGTFTTVCLNDGLLGSRKSINIPGVAVNNPSLSERDKENIRHAARLGVDFVAHSFVRSAADVEDVTRFILSTGTDMKVISKIENQQGVDNFDEIARASYGIMIARGDLGIEVHAELIPALQKKMIRRCIDLHRPVIVATQMLHSMIENPRPTRAEVSDVSAAVEQGADAIMLSGETAKGKYPVEAVATMTRIARAVETASVTDPLHVPPVVDGEITSFLARQAVISEARVHTKAIVTDTYTGRTARYIASFRAHIPTFAICYRDRVRRLLALSYGIMAFDGRGVDGKEKEMTDTIRHILEGQHLQKTDLVAYLGGRPGEGNGATFLEIDTITRITKP